MTGAENSCLLAEVDSVDFPVPAVAAVVVAADFLFVVTPVFVVAPGSIDDGDNRCCTRTIVNRPGILANDACLPF